MSLSADRRARMSAGRRCERGVPGGGGRKDVPRCDRSAAGFVAVGLALHNVAGTVLYAPFGYRCEEHARDGILAGDFSEAERKAFAEVFAKLYEIPKGATMHIGLTHLSETEVAELRKSFEVSELARPAAELPVEFVAWRGPVS
jgi:hypothetical protein